MIFVLRWVCLYAIFFTAALILPGHVLAHHGIYNFDLNKDITIHGIITDVAFINPHSWLYLDVADAAGQVNNWRCEMRTATQLRRSGWTKSMFTNGSVITVNGSPDKRKPHTCYLSTVIFADGKHIDRYGKRVVPEINSTKDRPLRLANGTPNISGDWAGEMQRMTDPRGIQGALVPDSLADNYLPGEIPVGTQAYPGSRGTDVSYLDGPLPVSGIWDDPVEMTEAGRQAAATITADDAETWRLSCQPTNIIYDFVFDVHVNRIIQESDRIILKYGYMDIELIIHLDRDKHPEDSLSTPLVSNRGDFGACLMSCSVKRCISPNVSISVKIIRPSTVLMKQKTHITLSGNLLGSTHYS
jgi:hypothetical protein